MLLKGIGKVLEHTICHCRPILHKYANEDVSLGSWFIGLEVEHIDERNMCCGTPPGIILLHIIDCPTLKPIKLCSVLIDDNPPDIFYGL